MDAEITRNGALLFTLIPLIGLGGVLLGLIKLSLASRRSKGFPPGPRGFPILGNLHQIPITKSYVKFHEWSKTYGAIIGLKLASQNVVVLNRWKPVRDLFDRRSAIYSSRPTNFIAQQLLFPNNIHILLSPYGPEWRLMRKLAQTFLNNRDIRSILPIQEAEASQTMYQIMKNSHGFYEHIRRYSSAVILATVYGQRAADADSPKVQAIYSIMERYTALLEPGATPPVDQMPFLKCLPEFLSPWKTRGKAIRRDMLQLYRGLVDETKAKVAQGKCPDCFLTSLLKEQDKNSISDEWLSYIAGLFMEAGSDTTSSTILTFVLAMAKFPEVYKKAQEEIDKTCTSAPTLSAVENLPYLHALMQETLRWRPIAPGGVPHALIQDDYYEGYYLPKGTMILANTWSIHRDEDEYDEPEDFRPERWIGNKFGLDVVTADNEARRELYSFGAGRRVCSGQTMAETSILINMAQILWYFNIKAVGFVDTDIATGFTTGFITAPKPFPAEFEIRSEEKGVALTQEFKASEEVMSVYV